MKISSLFLSVVTAFILLLCNKAFAAADIYFVHNDHLGTPQVLTNQEQNVVWQGDYKPFGEVDISISNVELDARFPGQYQDSETGVYYNYFRDYDPSLGRYIQSDPIGLEGGINTYGYALQNPISFIDPTGLITQCEIQALQQIINKYGTGPNVKDGGIITDPNATKGKGRNEYGGPIIIHTNPNQPEQYSGIVTDKNQSAALIITGLHENVHQGQNYFSHKSDAIQEYFSRGSLSNAQDAVDSIIRDNPYLISDFKKFVEKCRKTKTRDPDVDCK